MEYTKNYHLPQWVEEDRIQMEDFNDAMASIENGLSGKAEKTNIADMSEEITVIAQEIDVLSGDVGSIGKNARIVWGTYTGNGKYGASNPTRLDAGVYPVLAFVGCKSSVGYNGWPSIFIRDCPQSHSDLSMDILNVTWTDTGLSWYESTYNSAQMQNNQSGTVYYYCVIGYDKG